MRRAIYGGSFDPITNGHLWMVEQGAELFNELVVAIGLNPDKHYTFSIEDRLRVLKESIGNRPNVTIDSFQNEYLINYAKSVGAQYILRGIRDVRDYEYERGMRYINGDLQSGITTVFLMPPRPIAEVSSGFVKGLIGPDGWREVVKRYVPAPVYSLILDKYSHA